MNIEVNKKKFTPFITAQQINEQINILAAELNRDYEGKRPLFIAILNALLCLLPTYLRQLPLKQKFVL